MESIVKHQHGGNLTLVAAKYGLDPEKIMDFSVNVNPLGPPEGVKTLVENWVSYISIYPEPYCETLREGYASRLGISPESLIFSNGAVELIYMILQAVRPRTVLIPGPTFREYEIAARAFQAKIKQFRLAPEKGFLPALRSLMRAARGVDMVFLCSPNNPTGSLFPQDFLGQFLNFCNGRGVFVVIDESFLIFHNCWQELSAVRDTADNRNLFVLQSLTKFFSIPGLRVGYAAAHQDTIKYLSRFQPPWQVNALAQASAAEAVKDKDYAHRSRTFVEQERMLLAAALSAIEGINVYPSEAPYLLLELRANLTAPFVADELARKGILVRDCSNFAYLDDRFLRVAVKDREKNRLLAAELTGLINSGLQM
jgi:threonine-phosphate decarboxylase